MRTWHDFHLVGYAVDGKHNKLTFDLEWPHESRADPKQARLEFSDVECYYLEHDLGGNIVYAFEERSLREFLMQWTERFEAECRWGWPKFWRAVPHPRRSVEAELEDALQALSSRNVRCIELSSSYGLSGWVLAAGSREVSSGTPA